MNSTHSSRRLIEVKLRLLMLLTLTVVITLLDRLTRPILWLTWALEGKRVQLRQADELDSHRPVQQSEL